MTHGVRIKFSLKTVFALQSPANIGWWVVNPSGSLKSMSQAAWKIHPNFKSFEETLYTQEGELCTHDLITACQQRSIPSDWFHPSLFLSQVHVKVSVPKGVKFIGHPGKHHIARKKCVSSGEATPTSIVLSFAELGSVDITGIYQCFQTKSVCRLKRMF